MPEDAEVVWAIARMRFKIGFKRIWGWLGLVLLESGLATFFPDIPRNSGANDSPQVGVYGGWQVCAMNIPNIDELFNREMTEMVEAEVPGQGQP